MDQLSSLLLLLIFAGLFIALIKGGWTGPGGAQAWFKAKFLGQTT
jgi:hypothetical protein